MIKLITRYGVDVEIPQTEEESSMDTFIDMFGIIVYHPYIPLQVYGTIA